MKKAFFLCIVLAASISFSQNPPSKNDLVSRVIERAKENDRKAEQYGFYLESTTKKLNSENAVKEVESRTYRITWIENEPFLELLKIDGKEPSGKEWKKEKERKEKFVKSLHKKDKDDDEEDFTWDDIHGRYDFVQLPTDETGAIVISFQPKKGKLPERNRTDKLLNHMTGKFWADSNYNLIKIEAHLTDQVRYGLGLLAKIDDLQIQFMQQEHDKTWLPAILNIRGHGQFALFKNERREMNTRYYDYFKRPLPHAGGTHSD